MTAAVATTKGFDVVLVVHALLAATSLVVVLVLGAAATAVARGGALPASAARSFTGRREVAGRAVHLVALSGVSLVALSRGGYSLSTGFVDAGLGAWVVLAALLEGVAFPAQREVAAALAGGADARALARRMARACELAALVLVLTALVMVLGQA